MDHGSNQGFRTRLQQRSRALGTSLCVGADPHLDKMPPFFEKALREEGSEAFLTRFTRALIAASVGCVPAIKFQSAFYEAQGAPGFAVLTAMLAEARAQGLLTILDAKRGDIASTMAAYGQMAYGQLQADALTVMPYMGLDTIEPLLPWLRQGHGVYVVWLSSNPSGGQLQDLVALPLLTALLKYFADHGVSEALGLVLGATKVDALPSELRSKVADTCLLMPGVGAQGATVTPALRALVEASGSALVPQSRSLSAFPAEASSWEHYQQIVAHRIAAAAAELKL